MESVRRHVPRNHARLAIIWEAPCLGGCRCTNASLGGFMVAWFLAGPPRRARWVLLARAFRTLVFHYGREGGAYAEESCSDGLARHPAGTAKTLGRRWWCTLNRHLVRSRFSETVSISPPVRMKYTCGYVENLFHETSRNFWKKKINFEDFQKNIMLPLLLSFFRGTESRKILQVFFFLKHQVISELSFIRIEFRKSSPVKNDNTMISYVTDIYKYFIQRASPAWRNI